MRGDSNDARVAWITMTIAATLILIGCIALALEIWWMSYTIIGIFALSGLLGWALYKDWLPDDLRYDLMLIRYIKGLKMQKTGYLNVNGHPVTYSIVHKDTEIFIGVGGGIYRRPFDPQKPVKEHIEEFLKTLSPR